MILQPSSLYFPKGSQETIFWDTYKALCELPDAEKVVVADFHRTLSMPDEPTTWSMPAKSGLLSPAYCAERNALYEIYHPQEINNQLDDQTRNHFVCEWFQKHLNLLCTYRFSKNDFVHILEAVLPKEQFFRPGAHAFLCTLASRRIPLVLISAGLGNCIEERFTLAHIPTDFISLEANTLAYDAEGYVSQPLRNVPITSLNKGCSELCEKSRDFLRDKSGVLILGDEREDITLSNYVSKSTMVKIAYCSKGHTPDYFDHSDYDAVYLGDDMYWCADLGSLSTDEASTTLLCPPPQAQPHRDVRADNPPFCLGCLLPS